jgi:nucleoside-diphosphate-sugar epimerase
MGKGTKKIMLITGASGFIGRHMLEHFKDDYLIFAMARRSQQISRIQEHENIIWQQLDIANTDMVRQAFAGIAKHGQLDVVLHFAGYYDFSNDDNEEYELTNVLGTRNILEESKKAGIRKFIFSSSLTVTEFVGKEILIDEKSPADAIFPYAITKAKAELMIQDYSAYFDCSIVRLAAIFSDWCEYGPLFMFLTSWLGGSWQSRMLAGKGITAIPYLHIEDLARFVTIDIQRKNEQPCEILIASPDGSTTHQELFETAVCYQLRQKKRPILLPKWFARMGLQLRDWGGMVIGDRPFERPWMGRYIDSNLQVDASHTRRLLKWQPVHRYDVRRRLFFMIENMNSNPFEWDYRNYEAIYKNRTTRPNLLIYKYMINHEQAMIERTVDAFIALNDHERYGSYFKLKRSDLIMRTSKVFQMFKDAVRTRDRVHLLSYGKDLALKRFIEGFEAPEVIHAIKFIAESTVRYLSEADELEGLEKRIKDELFMTTQLLIDEVEDSFSRLTGFDYPHFKEHWTCEN